MKLYTRYDIIFNLIAKLENKNIDIVYVFLKILRNKLIFLMLS